MGGSLPLRPRQRASFSPAEAPKRQDEGAAKPSAQQHQLLVVLPDLPLSSHPEGVKSVFRSKCLLPGGKEEESIPL